jgi:hypothetical protein
MAEYNQVFLDLHFKPDIVRPEFDDAPAEEQLAVGKIACDLEPIMAALVEEYDHLCKALSVLEVDKLADMQQEVEEYMAGVDHMEGLVLQHYTVSDSLLAVYARNNNWQVCQRAMKDQRKFWTSIAGKFRKEADNVKHAVRNGGNVRKEPRNQGPTEIVEPGDVMTVPLYRNEPRPPGNWKPLQQFELVRQRQLYGQTLTVTA